jgi:hypothetical protein
MQKIRNYREFVRIYFEQDIEIAPPLFNSAEEKRDYYARNNQKITYRKRLSTMETTPRVMAHTINAARKITAKMNVDEFFDRSEK